MIQIAIIGGGPAGVSLCMQLKEKLLHHNLQHKVKVLVFEKKSRMAVGLPYGNQEPSHIINLPKEVMEPLPGERNKFSQWHAHVTNNELQTSFPPRYYFGKYLESVALRTRKESEEEGLSISYLTNTEVLDIQEQQMGLFNLITAQGTYLVNYVILSTGHMPSSSFTEFLGHNRYIHNPWNLNLYEQIDSDDTIGIIGTRLTAIDIVLKLKERRHKGKIVMASRSGLLPTVLGKAIPSYSLKYLTIKALESLTNFGRLFLNLDNLISLFWKEIYAFHDKNSHLKNLPKSFKDISPLEWINNEIEEAEQGARCWQQVLFALYPLTPYIWSLLNNNDKTRFFNDYNSLFINYLAAFPLDNAYKIKEMLSSGFIEIFGHLTQVERIDDQYSFHVANKEKRTFLYLINATGPGYDPTQVDLLKKMLKTKLLSIHVFGGIKVDRNSLHVISEENKVNPNLFAIGELTKGEFFLTTDLGIVTNQAKTIATHLVSQLVRECSSNKTSPILILKP